MSTKVIPKRGYFITFEGSDGAGKSTQIDLLRQALQIHGFNVLMTREPGGTEISERIRDIVKNPKNKNMCHEAELLLLNAARAQIVREVIRPALEDRKIVLCDRFYHSTIIYQGFGRELDKHMVRATIDFAIGDTKPDVTFLLYLDPQIAKKRADNRTATDTRFEEEDDGFRDRVNQGIEWLKGQELAANGKLVAINADNRPEEVHNEIYRCIAARLAMLTENELEMDASKWIIKPPEQRIIT